MFSSPAIEYQQKLGGAYVDFSQQKCGFRELESKHKEILLHQLDQQTMGDLTSINIGD